MKDLYIVANWKANKTAAEAIEWLREISPLTTLPASNKKMIVCPSYLSVPTVSEFIKSNDLPIEIGVQNVSSFEGGAYTGEVSVHQVAEFAKYAIIGHSERRNNFAEDDEVLTRKVSTAVRAGLLPIFCVQNENALVPPDVKIVAYEPVEAIGTGNPDTPENAQRIASTIKSKCKDVTHVLYGGSVTADNVTSFTNQRDISGVLVGGASLNPTEFSSLIKQC